METKVNLMNLWDSLTHVYKGIIRIFVIAFKIKVLFLTLIWHKYDGVLFKILWGYFFVSFCYMDYASAGGVT